MKIVFFSRDGCSGVTSNMAAISILGILEERMKILALENHWSREGIARYYLQGYSPNIVKDGYVRYFGHGLEDNLVSHFALRTNTRKADFMSVELIQNSLYYMPQYAYQEDVFDYEFCTNIIPKLDYLETVYPYLFLDTKNHTMNTKLILDLADLVIVNFKQDMQEIHSFFQEYSSLQEKSIFLISNYRTNQSCNINHISKKFHISKNAIFKIAHNSQYEHALYRGRVINFIYDNIAVRRGHSNYVFIHDLMRITEQIGRNTDFRLGREQNSYEKENVSL